MGFNITRTMTDETPIWIRLPGIDARGATSEDKIKISPM